MSAATEEEEKIFVYLCNIERQISIDKRTQSWTFCLNMLTDKYHGS